jgi:hypothetical protein
MGGGVLMIYYSAACLACGFDENRLAKLHDAAVARNCRLGDIRCTSVEKSLDAARRSARAPRVLRHFRYKGGNVAPILRSFARFRVVSYVDALH